MITPHTSRATIDDSAYVQGNRSRWKLIRLLGEGDAGEIYLVESFLDKKVAILKRPRPSSFPADILRQANQIDTEARILNALSYTPLADPASPVRFAGLLDGSLPGNELTERFFIIVERAPGLDLATLRNFHRYNYHDERVEAGALDEKAKQYLHMLSELREIPELVVLRVLDGLFELLETIHHQPVRSFHSEQHGIVWNDIKLDHMFWDPVEGHLTVIDWGNGQFLEADSVSADRHYSPADDYRQLIEGMGKFILECAPQLLAQLHWPAYLTPAGATREALASLREKVAGLAQERIKGLRAARLQEVAMISADPPQAPALDGLAEIQRRIVASGELPDLDGAARVWARLAALLAEGGDWEEFNAACCRLARALGTSGQGKWRLLEEIYAAAVPEDGGSPSPEFGSSLRSGLGEDWPACLWQVCLATRLDPHGARWEGLSRSIRALALDPSLGPSQPYGAAVELLQSLEEGRPRILDRLSEAIAAGNLPDPDQPEKLLRSFESLIARFKNETLKKWTEPEPVPPGGGLAYTDVEAILAEMDAFLPRLGINARQLLGPLRAALAQPKAQAEIVLDAWQAKGFKTTHNGLRNLLLWDPDRRRVLAIDALLQSTPDWLEESRRGPQIGERLPDYALRMEYAYREMRSRIASVHWIESALTLFSELRGGRRPGEILAENPRLADAFTWLQRYERKSLPSRRLDPPASLPATGDERRVPRLAREALLGQGQAVSLAGPLDAWVPEAKGSSARVFQGFLQDPNGQLKGAAIKIMRPDKADYSLPLFCEEVQILAILQDVPGVARMHECGFIELNDSQSLPAEDSLLPAHGLVGKLIHYSTDETGEFLGEIQTKTSQGWLPYLAVEKKSKEDSLLLLCDEGYTRGRVLPVEVGLAIAVKINDILEIAHARHIAYRDHKILHYYWNSRLHKVSMIDWNVAKWYPQGISENEIRHDLVQFGARTLHHILTGRPAPGALPVGPNQPYEIEMAPERYSTAWTYDDGQRIPADVRELLAQVLSGSYDSAARLREDLLLQLPYRKD